MRLSYLMKNAALVTLAAAMAITALPAAAQDGHRGRGGERGGGEQSRGWNGGDGNRGGGDNRAAPIESRSSNDSSYRGSRSNSTSTPVQIRGNDAPINQVRARSRQIDNGVSQGGNSRGQVARDWDRTRSNNGSASIAPQNRAATAEVVQNDNRRWSQGRDADRAGRSGDRYERRDNSGVTYRNGSARTSNRANDYDRRANGEYRNDNRAANGSYTVGNRRDRYDNGRSTYNNGRYASNDRDRNYRRWDNRSWRNDRRYDWYGYRSSNRSLYRLGSYYAPYRNYSYRRLGVGFYLDTLFFGSRYWISDPFRYRLPPVYGPYRWVRYYDDALLVDTYSGQVVDVIYSFFW